MIRFPRNLLFSVLTVAIVVSLLAVPVLFAQDSEDTVTCSSDLIVMLYVAERYFNFGSVHDMMMQDSEDMVDLTRFERGQFAGTFDSMMSDDGMSDSMMDKDRMSAISESMEMDDSTMMDQLTGDMDTTDMVMLSPTTIEDEPEECSALRSELSRFFTAVAMNDRSTGVEMEATVEPGMETTAEADMDATEEADMTTPTESSADMTTTPDATMEATEDTEAATPADAGVESTQAASEMTTRFTAPLSGPQEVPGPGDADATGTATVTINSETNEVCWDMTVMNAMLPASAAHIHIGAFGVSGDVVVPLSAPDASGLARDCTTADAEVVSAILANPANYYVNVHTSDFPNGALRGQLS